MTMMTPFATFCTDDDRLFWTNTFVSVWKMRTPKTVPVIVPRPPESSVPPTTTAAIASSSRSCPCVDVPAVVRPRIHTAADGESDVEGKRGDIRVDLGGVRLL